MRFTLALLITCLAGGQLKILAQITISNEIFPQVGDTLFYAFDESPGDVLVGLPGGDQHWDFADLNTTSTFQLIFAEPSEGEMSDTFPDAELLYFDSGVEAYINVEPDKVEILGLFGPDPVGLGLELVYQFQPPIIERRAPMNFQDVNLLHSELLIPLDSDELPDNLLDQLPVKPDSFRVMVTLDRTDEVDAWGTLAIPGSQHEVLREKRTEMREAILEAKVPLLGWQDVTDIAQQYLEPGILGKNSSINYYFFSREHKEVIALVIMDSDQETPTGVQFRDNRLATSVNDLVVNQITDLRIYPNPGRDAVTIEFNADEPGNYTIEITDPLGTSVWTGNFGFSGQAFKRSVGGLPAGLLFFQLKDAAGNLVISQKLLILR